MMRTTITRKQFLASQLALSGVSLGWLTVSCGDDDDDVGRRGPEGGDGGEGGEGGTGGEAGTAGDPGEGGAAGEPGAGGQAGTAGEAGAGGEAGTAGEPGTGGQAGMGGGPAIESCEADVGLAQLHTHNLEVPAEDVAAGVDVYELSEVNGHIHTLTLTEDDLAALLAGETIEIDSSVNAAHSHPVTVSCA